ncbi:transglutaminase-like cysteine peptidase [Kiloniella sp. b19]|uniref:transglutaminase-like cysteine peptidase n=1 Tax=Kiloniella sp. GXU_MW_B19 TaxID=3141326 RepID=UPI0031E27496
MYLKTPFKFIAPRAWKDLIQREKWLIGGTLKRVSYEEWHSAIKETFHTVKHSFRYVADPKGPWGLTHPEDGSLTGRPVLRGDCDGFVLEVFRKLVDQDLPVEALRWVIGKTEQGGHMIGIVETDQLSLVIDFNQDSPVSLDELDYCQLRFASNPSGQWFLATT